MQFFQKLEVLSFQICLATSHVAMRASIISKVARVGVFASGMVAIAFSDSKDPMNCLNPSCAEKLKFFTLAKKESTSSSGATTNVYSSSSQNIAVLPPPTVSEDDCPLDRAEVGHSSWNLLHTLAANYPDNPTEEEKAHAKAIIYGLAALYPCHVCAADFRENVRLNPPKVDTRNDFVLWLCEQHNRVNEKLNKPLFNCNINALDLRWRKGAEGCWDYKWSLAQEREDEEEANAAESEAKSE